MLYNTCHECEHNNKASCALSACSEKLRKQFCPFLKLQIREYDDSHVEKLTERLLARIEAVSGAMEPTPHKEMDYSRDDTEYLARKFKPNIN
jgi:hypothetical protein